jgi:hypothetical protein
MNPIAVAVIAKNAEWSYLHSLHNLKAAFPEGEAVISTSAKWSYHYAKDILQAPFPLGEKAIAKDVGYYKLYKSLFPKPAFFTY